MRVILDVATADDLSLALAAFVNAAKDDDCRKALMRYRGVVGIRIGDRFWSVSTSKASFTVRESKS